GVGIAADLVRVEAVGQGDGLAVGGVGGGAVGVEVVDGVSLVLPRFRQVRALFGGDHGGQHPVVVDVVPVIARRVDEDDLPQPFDAPAADLTGDDDAQGLSVVRV